MEFVPEEYLWPSIAALVGNLLIFTGLTFFMLRGLANRRGLFSRFGLVLAGLGVQGALLFSYNWLDNIILTPAANAGYDLNEIGLNFANFGDVIFTIGAATLVLVFILNRRDAPRWFPSHNPR